MAIDHDVRAGADWAVEVLTAAGYRADFSPSSLWEIERFLNAEAPDGRPRSRGLLGKDLDVRVAMLGGYVGEVIRRRVGGTWVRDGDHAALDLPGGARIWPAQQVMHRLATGAGGSLTAYASAAGADPGPSTPVLQCRCCGAVPAADTKFRAVQSVLIWIGYTRARARSAATVAPPSSGTSSRRCSRSAGTASSPWPRRSSCCSTGPP
ncbi:hypothetical protein [Dactylosporangium maewongense]|uniref:hypothetical protein n=1 Tax=Dactylosporangium maewongense TaxID=634393 RepID=UPI0031D2529C